MGDGIGQAAFDRVEDIKKVIGGVAAEAGNIGKSLVERQKDALADEVSCIGRALRSASKSFAKPGSTRSEAIGAQFIDYIDDFADSLRSRDLDTLVADTATFARARPVAYIIAAVAFGFIVGRFFKSKAAA